MLWKTHGERQIYTNKWVNLCLVDVQQPDGRRWEYHVVRLRHRPWPPWSMIAKRC